MTSRPPPAAALHEEIGRAIEAESAGILGLLEELHRDPELSGEEFRAASRLTGVLRGEGFGIEESFCGLPTAFLARRRPGNRRRAEAIVGFLAEYDALPGIGHGCGHNLIAAAALGAGIAVGRLADRLGGEVRVYGTPAEETIGGKAVLAAAGAFDDLDAAMMVHPGFEHRVLTDSLACRSIQVEFHGRAAHAVAHPDKGINALDAMIQLFVAVDGIRRASPRDVHLPGVILHGGVRPNVVPDRAVAQFSVRAATAAQRNAILARLERTVAAIGAATGCGTSTCFIDNPYDEMTTNRPLAGVYRSHLAARGIGTNDDPREHKGSLDMGNVSLRAPSIHPYVAIVPPEIASHTQAFADATISKNGREATLLSADTLARTAVDVIVDAPLRGRMRDEFERARARAGPRDVGEIILERPDGVTPA